MDFEKLANEFIKQHEGVGYQSRPQTFAIRSFAKWLNENASQQSFAADGSADGHSEFCDCPECLFDPNSAVNRRR